MRRPRAVPVALRACAAVEHRRQLARVDGLARPRLKPSATIAPSNTVCPGCRAVEQQVIAVDPDVALADLPQLLQQHRVAAVLRRRAQPARQRLDVAHRAGGERPRKVDRQFDVVRRLLRPRRLQRRRPPPAGRGRAGNHRRSPARRRRGSSVRGFSRRGQMRREMLRAGSALQLAPTSAAPRSVAASTERLPANAPKATTPRGRAARSCTCAAVR